MFFHSNMELCRPSKYQHKLLPHIYTRRSTTLLHIYTYDKFPSDVNYRAKLSTTAVSNLVWVGLFYG